MPDLNALPALLCLPASGIAASALRRRQHDEHLGRANLSIGAGAIAIAVGAVDPVIAPQAIAAMLRTSDLLILLALTVFVGVVLFSCMGRITDESRSMRVLAGLISGAAIVVAVRQFTPDAAHSVVPAVVTLISFAVAFGLGGPAPSQLVTLGTGALLLLGLLAMTVPPQIVVTLADGHDLGLLAGGGLALALVIGAAGGLALSRAAHVARNTRREVQTWLGDIAQATPEPLAIIENNQIAFANNAFVALLEQPAHLLPGRVLADLFPRAAHAWLAAAIDGRMRDWSDAKLASARGLIAVEVAVRPLHGADRWHLLQVRDVRPKLESEARIQYLTRHDALTGLLNRTQLIDRLTRRASQARQDQVSFAVLLIDLDDFEAFNDLHGQGAGDVVLSEMGKRIVAAAGPDAMVARSGGDEFAVLLPAHLDRRAVERLAQALLSEIATPCRLDATVVTLSASAGVVFYPRDTTDADELLVMLGLALQRAKLLGRGQFAGVDADRDNDARNNRMLEDDLRFALSRRQLQVWLQPQVNSHTGSLTGFEALLRWKHPVHGMIPPDRFIPWAEASGQINAIGAWVLEEATRIAAGWTAPLSIAVNVSPVQLRAGTLPQLVATLLRASSLAPQQLELEITESVVIDRRDDVLRQLNEIKALGVRIALDDFGTGHSSLGILRSFPFSKLKMDRCFLRDIGENEKARAVVRTVISFGQALDMQVVAEGVETTTDVEILRAEGCNLLQGYLFSKPQPSEHFRDLIPDRCYASLLPAPDSLRVIPLKPDEGQQYGRSEGDAVTRSFHGRRGAQAETFGLGKSLYSRQHKPDGEREAENIQLSGREQAAKLHVTTAKQTPPPGQQKRQQADSSMRQQQPERGGLMQQRAANQQQGEPDQQQGVRNPPRSQIHPTDGERKQSPGQEPFDHV